MKCDVCKSNLGNNFNAITFSEDISRIEWREMNRKDQNYYRKDKIMKVCWDCLMDLNFRTLKEDEKSSLSQGKEEKCL